MKLPPELAEAVDRHFERMIGQQRTKVFEMARRRVPHLTREDVLNPQDFPRLMADPDFNFEDGVLGGLIQAQMSVRAGLTGGDPEPAPGSTG